MKTFDSGRNETNFPAAAPAEALKSAWTTTLTLARLRAEVKGQTLPAEREDRNTRPRPAEEQLWRGRKVLRRWEFCTLNTNDDTTIRKFTFNLKTEIYCLFKVWMRMMTRRRNESGNGSETATARTTSFTFSTNCRQKKLFSAKLVLSLSFFVY